jgi:hypothetical protein
MPLIAVGAGGFVDVGGLLTGGIGVGTGIGAGVGVGVLVPVDGVVPPLVSVPEGVAAEPEVPEVAAGVKLFEAAACEGAFSPVAPAQPQATATTRSARKKRIA